jgi:predicted flavoprotein YhiN
VAPLAPANCGFDVDWSGYFSSRHAGEHLPRWPSRRATATACWSSAGPVRRHAGGVEGSLIYALSSALRDQIAAEGSTTIWLDLAPDLDRNACSRK